MRSFTRSRLILPALGAAGLFLVAACGSSSAHGNTSMPGMNTTTFPATPSTPSGAASMPGMDNMDTAPMATGDGLAASSRGFTLSPASAALGAGGFSFRILGPGGRPVTAFEADQTKLMHFYLVRSDLTGFQHVHPTMAADGTWTAPITTVQAGSYRLYTSFITQGADAKPVALVLSTTAEAPGSATTEAAPPPSETTTVDGYTVTVDTPGIMAGMAMPLKVSISKDGQPVTSLQPYLETYAHLTAIHSGDLAFAHLHPAGPAAMTDTGGPDLTFGATFPKAGAWRLFLQFQTAGVLHTAAITVNAR